MSLPKSVFIRELGPREGFQTSSKIVPTRDKLELIQSLNSTGVRFIEITSFVRADRVPQMADAAEVVANFEKKPNVQYAALYLNSKGYQLAATSQKLSLPNWFYTSASETFLKNNNNLSFEQMLNGLADWVKVFCASNNRERCLMVSNAFGCSQEGLIEAIKVQEHIKRIVEKLSEVETKLTEICLADTVGLATPNTVSRLVAGLRSCYPDCRLSLHLHDTRGSGMANAYAGLMEGIDLFDTSVAGMGGCPFAKGAAGNLCTEDFAYMCEGLGINTGLDLKAYCQSARLAERIMGVALPGKLYKVM